MLVLLSLLVCGDSVRQVLRFGWEKVGGMVRIYLTGSVAIESNGKLVSDWKSAGRQGRLAFAMLAAEHTRATSREDLASELWPVESPPSRDRALTAVISKVRSLLDDSGLGTFDIVSAFGSYQLRLPPGSWIDTRAALESIDKAEGALRLGQVKSAWPLAQATCHIARRPFLHGEDGPWVTRKRRELRQALVRSHECLAQIYIHTGECSTAAIHASSAVDLEPFRETAHLLLMRAHAVMGNRAEALRAYERCRALLAEELGVSPSHAIDAEYLQVLRSGG
jgi:DNA-binding SARP family transcriptional activator